MPSSGKLALLTPVDLIVIQCALSQPFAGRLSVLSVDPAVTRIVSPHAAAVMSACTAEVVESGPRTAPGEGVPLTGVYMHRVGKFAGPSVVAPDHVPEGEQYAFPEGFTTTGPPLLVLDWTVTVADAALVGSAWLVAMTVSVAPLDGAVYRPDVLMLPNPALQVTAVLLLPVTLAENCTEPSGCTSAVPGVTFTFTETGVVAGFTVTAAEAAAVDDAALLAVTVTEEIAVTLGAVSKPLLVMEPAVVDHVTLVLLEPLTEAVNC
jgi:hypothetical protein